jgi:hypothetical protein
MRFKLEFECNNATFDEDPLSEISCILDKLSIVAASRDLDEFRDGIKVTDMNGNAIGTMRIE